MGLLDERSERRESDRLQQERLRGSKAEYSPRLENKVTKYEAGKEVAPGITSIATPGHTPGHMSFAVASGSASALVQSDVTNIPEFFMRHPDWHCRYLTSIRNTARRPATSSTTWPRPRSRPWSASTSVPVRRLCREGRHRLPAGAGCVEPGDLSAKHNFATGRPPARRPSFFVRLVGRRVHG